MYILNCFNPKMYGCIPLPSPLHPRHFSNKMLIPGRFPVAFFMPPGTLPSILLGLWKRPENAAISFKVIHRPRVKPKMTVVGDVWPGEW